MGVGGGWVGGLSSSIRTVKTNKNKQTKKKKQTTISSYLTFLSPFAPPPLSPPFSSPQSYSPHLPHPSPFGGQ